MTINPHLEISEGLRDLLKRAMAKTRSERFANANDMLEALDALQEAGRRLGPSAVRRAVEDAAPANTLAAPIPAVRARVAAPERDPATAVSATAIGVPDRDRGSADEARAFRAPPSPPAEDLGEPSSPAPAPADPLAGPLPEELAPFYASVLAECCAGGGVDEAGARPRASGARRRESPRLWRASRSSCWPGAKRARQRRKRPPSGRAGSRLRRLPAGVRDPGALRRSGPRRSAGRPSGRAGLLSPVGRPNASVSDCCAARGTP